MRYRGVVLACLFVGLRSAAALAQTPALPNKTVPSLSSATSLVLVPAMVRTKAGAIVYTLKAGDFAVTDDGVPQQVLLDQDAGKEPLALVVVVEVGGAGARQFQNYPVIAPPLAPMLSSIVGNVAHLLAVVTFDSHPALLQSFTSDTEQTAAALRSLQVNCTRQHHLDNCESPLAVHDVPLGDNGAAILDSLEYAVDLLRTVPRDYRRAILLISETLDRGSETTIAEAVRAITDTNTTIYSIGFSTAKSEAAHYAARQLPTQPSGRPSGLLSQENHHPNPVHGCMGHDPKPDPDGPANRWEQAYDCLGQLVPPLTFAKIAAIATIDGLKRDVPETVAHLTGGEHFRFTDAKSLERDLAAISNELPNRYVLSFYPQSPHEGLHIVSVSLPSYSNLEITARSRYWADTPGK